MMNVRPIDPEELKWQRRDDARTLARAEEIKADKECYDGAKIGAKEILAEETARLNGLTKVAGRRPSKIQQQQQEDNQQNMRQPLYHSMSGRAKPSRKDFRLIFLMCLDVKRCQL